MRRRLLRQAVEENYATIFGTPAPSAVRRKVWRRISRVSAWSGALAVLVALIFVVVTRGLGRPSVAAAAGVALTVPPPPARPRLADPTVEPRFDPSSAQPMNRTVLPFSVRRIIVDAGHGGEHRGTASPLGVEEKEVTLDLAERLAGLLRAGGFEPLLTREGDETLSLMERGNLANDQDGDVFVSIHVNWFSESEVRAVETFYLGPTQSSELQRLAARENLDSEIPLGEFRKALERVYADVRRSESAELAHSIQQELLKSLQTVNPAVEDRGVKSAPFGVLIRTKMPAILTEVGCLSNEEEARLLESSEYRQFLAEALFEGIRSYALGLNPNLILGS